MGSYYPRESLLAGQLLVKQVSYYTDYEKRLVLARKFIEAAADSIYRNLRYYNGRGKDVSEYLRDVDSLRKLAKQMSYVDMNKLYGKIEGKHQEKIIMLDVGM